MCCESSREFAATPLPEVGEQVEEQREADDRQAHHQPRLEQPAIDRRVVGVGVGGQTVRGLFLLGWVRHRVLLVELSCLIIIGRNGIEFQSQIQHRRERQENGGIASKFPHRGYNRIIRPRLKHPSPPPRWPERPPSPRMSLENTESLLAALRTSGLLAPEQLRLLTAEVRPFRKDFPAVLKHLLKTEWLTVYQLRKVLHGKAAELFVGPYLILDRPGEVGWAACTARQTRIGRVVALKVIRPSLLASPLVRARYQREVEAAGVLRHPNIVAVEDAGEADGKSYLAMEFVDGIDLSLLMRDYRMLEVVEACEYARQTALGLQHACELGFVHRDIKPSNIVVAGERHVPQATERAVVKILDMGLVRAIGLEEELPARGVPGGGPMRRDGLGRRHPDYMAPSRFGTPRRSIAGGPLQPRLHALLPAHRPAAIRGRKPR